MNRRCDFCNVNDPEPAWSFASDSFQYKDMGWGHVGSWLACQECADLINADKQEALVARAVAAYMQLGVPETPRLALELNENLGGMLRMFFQKRKGEGRIDVGNNPCIQDSVSRVDGIRHVAEAAVEYSNEQAEDMNFASAMKLMESQHPDLWKVCYPKIYQNTGRYGSPKMAAAAMVMASGWIEYDHFTNAPGSAKAIYFAASKAKQNNMPTLFVAPELLTAVSQTRPPGELRWMDIKLPFEAGVFCLPVGALKHPDGHSADIIGWARIGKNDVLKLSPRCPEARLHHDLFVTWTCIADEKFSFFDSSLNGDTSPCIEDWNASGEPGSIVNTKTGETRPLHRETIYDIPLAGGEEDFLHQVRGLVFNLLLALDARPELLTRGGRVKGVKTKSGLEIWKPNIVGKTYKFEREGVTAVAVGGSGHASPRLHWRRGHYRRQHYGMGRTEIKTIWIEPTLVGE
jgi:hypothetical protein